MNQPVWHEPHMSRSQRWQTHNLKGMTLWLTGLSGSGKSTIAHALAERLNTEGTLTYVLDADNLRHGLNADLGFDDDDRRENVRRVAEVAKLFADAGAVTLVPIISPFANGRNFARSVHDQASLAFAEVYVSTSAAECERRDTKGLYAKVRNGEMSGLSGVDAPYEPPTSPELVVDTAVFTVEQCVDLLQTLVQTLAAP